MTDKEYRAGLKLLQDLKYSNLPTESSEEIIRGSIKIYNSLVDNVRSKGYEKDDVMLVGFKLKTFAKIWQRDNKRRIENKPRFRRRLR